MKTNKTSPALTFGAGFFIGILGGLIGLGGAEFRLPVLIDLFGFGALQAVILNKAMSLIVVSTALPLRSGVISLSQILEHWPILITLLSDSLIGAWIGAGWATKIQSQTLYKVISALLVFIAFALLLTHTMQLSGLKLGAITQVLIGSIAGVGIGLIAAIMGVAGGELLIPTIVLLFGVDIKLAGSLSLAVSFPTMLVGFARYSQSASFLILYKEWKFLLMMAAGSILGVFVGGQLLGVISTTYLIPLLILILLVSAKKTWDHS